MTLCCRYLSLRFLRYDIRHITQLYVMKECRVLQLNTLSAPLIYCPTVPPIKVIGVVSLGPEARHQGAACDSSTLACNWPDLHGEVSTLNHLAEKSCSGCFVCWICTCLCLFSIMVQHSIVCRMNPVYSRLSRDIMRSTSLYWEVRCGRQQ